MYSIWKYEQYFISATAKYLPKSACIWDALFGIQRLRSSYSVSSLEDISLHTVIANLKHNLLSLSQLLLKDLLLFEANPENLLLKCHWHSKHVCFSCLQIRMEDRLKCKLPVGDFDVSFGRGKDVDMRLSAIWHLLQCCQISKCQHSNNDIKKYGHVMKGLEKD